MKTKIFHIIYLVLTFLCINTYLPGQEITIGPGGPSNLRAFDYPWDHGDKINLEWTISKDDPESVALYSIFRSDPSNPDSFIFIDNVDPGINRFTIEKLKKEESYYFRVSAVDGSGNISKPALSTFISPSQQWFDGRRLPLFLITMIFCGSVVYWIYHARSGRPLNIRKIAGLEAVDEAVGRATEMGRSILFIPGIQDMNEIQTIAGITVLSRVAKVAAEYDARVEVPTSRSLVMTAARETVQASFLTAGRPESYNQDLVYYVTDEQFGYVAYVQGMMVREKPAACFYMGAFFAESLILAETGNTIGAIQVAGTAMPAQLPFFVAACDYTLIGEEFFAASAYLSGEPDQLGSLKGQDIGKIIVAAGIIIGVSLLTLGTIAGPDTDLGNAFITAAEFLKSVILT
mgnify:CR=1 FL=1|tara:strand:- start:10 stop:1218 length:1209 start_codon:yes stop_codon:yes gene_type:complete